jgi:cupin superfamily acireductone dioxygenase involved in methionine salvage
MRISDEDIFRLACLSDEELEKAIPNGIYHRFRSQTH